MCLIYTFQFSFLIHFFNVKTCKLKCANLLFYLLLSVSVLISHIKERTWTSGFTIAEYLVIRRRSRSQWPRGRRRTSAVLRLLRFWARISPGAWISVCCECCMLSGRGLRDELIFRPEESYRLWCVVFDLEIS
jgi:hypothetical protein